MRKRHVLVSLSALVMWAAVPALADAASFALTVVVDDSTPIPGGTGTFRCIVGYSISGSSVAFWGSGFRPPFFCDPSGIYRFDGTAVQKVADTSTPIPGGSGTFTQFGSPPLISGNNVAFQGFGPGGQQGIYVLDGSTLRKVADTSTPIPDGTGTFSSFFGFAQSGSNIAFFGAGSSEGGIYLFDGTRLSTVADMKTAIPPGGLGTFGGFGSVAISGSHVVFDAGGTSFGQEGIYLFDGAGLSRVADTSMAMPGGTGNFIIFLSDVVISGNDVAFKALGPGFDEGIYAFDGATLRKVVDRSTAIPAATATFYDFGLPVNGGPDVAFIGVSESQAQGVYAYHGGALERVADARTLVPGGVGTFTRFFGPAITDSAVAFGGDGSAGEQGIFFFNGTTVSAVADTSTPVPGRQDTLAGFSSPPVISGDHVAFAARSPAGHEGIFLASRDAIGPAKLWLGLKSSDDIGLRLDVAAEVFRNTTLVASGEVDNQPAGSSGFNNAALRTIALTSTGDPVEFAPGDIIGLRLSVRRTCSGPGHNAGTVRLWYGGGAVDGGKQRDAGSRFDATVDGVDTDYFLNGGFHLDAAPGVSRHFVDVLVTDKSPCPQRAFTPFGFWTVAVP